MPVAFSPPPFPSVEPPKAAPEAAQDASSPPPDAFAQVLHAAGNAASAGPTKESDAALTKESLLRIADRLHGGKKAGPIARTPEGPLVPVGPGARNAADPQASAPGTVPSDANMTTVAMMAALSAAITPGADSDAVPRAGIAGGERGASGGRPVEILGSGPLDASASIQDAAAGTEAAGKGGHGIAQDARMRARGDEMFGAATAPALTAGARESEMLALSAASKELFSDSAAKPKDAADTAGISASTQAFAATHMERQAVTAVTQTIETPVTAPGWEGEFAGKLTQVVLSGSDRAEFHLHPAELGPVDVKITFAADQAIVLITAAHPATRDALEQALPHLRHMLADQGITLGQANVQTGERNPADTGAAARAEAARPDVARQDLPDLAVRTVRLRGLVDVFA